MIAVDASVAVVGRPPARSTRRVPAGVALTAAEHNVGLVTRDRRAWTT